jgi:hypothetical protein
LVLPLLEPLFTNQELGDGLKNCDCDDDGIAALPTIPAVPGTCITPKAAITLTTAIRKLGLKRPCAPASERVSELKDHPLPATAVRSGL